MKSHSVQKQLTKEEAQTFVNRNHETIQWVQSNLKKAQKAITLQINKHCCESDFTVDDWVYVTHKEWATEWLNLKLDHQAAESYKILTMKGHFYVLNLLRHIKINAVFHTDRLRKSSENFLSKQIQESESFTEVNEESEYTVNTILTSWVSHSVLQYQVTWLDFDSDTEWYDVNDFIELSDKIKAFHDTYSAKTDLSKRLEVWMKVFKTDKELKLTDEDNVTVTKKVRQQQRRKA